MANPVGQTQPTPVAITPNASLTTGQKNALNALQTARAAFETSGVSIYIAEVNILLAAVDTCLAAMV